MAKTKRIIGALILSSVCMTSFAYDFESEGIYYNVLSQSDKTCEVTYESSSTYNSYSGEIDVPSTVNYDGTIYKVTSVGANAFRGCTELTYVRLSYAVTNIGDNAFSDCSNLSTFTLCEAMTRIGAEAFSGCTGLRRFSSEAMIPPACGENALAGIDKSMCTLYIPRGTYYTKYAYAAEWCMFPSPKYLEEIGHILYIETASNPLITIKVYRRPVITFTDTELKLSFDSGKYAWTLEDFKKWYLGRYYDSSATGKDSPATGIKDLSANGMALQFIPSGVSVKGAKGQRLIVSDTAGGLIESRLCEENDFVLSVKEYPAGVYIVKVGTQTLKLYVNK